MKDFKLRTTMEIDLRSAISTAVSKALAYKMPFQCCLNCKNFDEPNDICKRYNQRPPARVITFGCPSYDDEDDIPF